MSKISAFSTQRKKSVDNIEYYTTFIFIINTFSCFHSFFLLFSSFLFPPPAYFSHFSLICQTFFTFFLYKTKKAAVNSRFFIYTYFSILIFPLQMSCVIVPIGQYTHQERGLNNSIVTNPSTVEVSITL